MSERSNDTIHREMMSNLKALSVAAPELTRAFMGLHGATMKNGAIDTRTKELMALAIGISTRCEGCVVSHLRAALQAGATREQVLETIGVAVMMAGGPGMVYAGKALKALDEFAPAD